MVLSESFTKREIDVMTAIEQSIVWHGPYRSPVRAEQLISTIDHNLFSAPVFRYPNDHFDTCTLFDRLQIGKSRAVLNPENGTERQVGFQAARW